MAAKLGHLEPHLKRCAEVPGKSQARVCRHEDSPVLREDLAQANRRLKQHSILTVFCGEL